MPAKPSTVSLIPQTRSTANGPATFAAAAEVGSMPGFFIFRLARLRPASSFFIFLFFAELPSRLVEDSLARFARADTFSSTPRIVAAVQKHLALAERGSLLFCRERKFGPRVSPHSISAARSSRDGSSVFWISSSGELLSAQS